MKANKLILSGREQKNPFGDWVKLYDWFVCLLGKSLESWIAEIERSGLSSRFISLFTTFLQQEKRFIVKLCFCRLTCLECQKKNHGDPKPVFPLGHPHTSSETNYFQRPTSCKDRSTKNNQVLQYTVANCWCPNSIQQERQRVKRDTNLATEKHLFLEFWLDPLKTLKLVRKKSLSLYLGPLLIFEGEAPIHFNKEVDEADALLCGNSLLYFNHFSVLFCHQTHQSKQRCAMQCEL